MSELVITQWPIVILSNYRTGSSGFAIILRHRHDAKRLFSEPSLLKEKYDSFIQEYVSGNRKFILKVMIDQLDDSPIYREILADTCYKIRLLRENIIDQCISYYVARTSEKWQYNNDTVHTPYSTPIDVDAAIFAVDRITKNDKKLRECNIQFDQECTYETIDFSNSPRTRKIIPPDNIDEIRELITRMYHERTN